MLSSSMQPVSNCSDHVSCGDDEIYDDYDRKMLTYLISLRTKLSAEGAKEISRYLPKFTRLMIQTRPPGQRPAWPSEDNDSNSEEERDHEQDNFGDFGDDTLIFW